jgi:hypothetical protein
MLRTKALLIYKATGNLRAIQMLLGHRYLGVDVDDVLSLSEEATEIRDFQLRRRSLELSAKRPILDIQVASAIF